MTINGLTLLNEVETNGKVVFEDQVPQYLFVMSPLFRILSPVSSDNELNGTKYITNIRKAPAHSAGSTLPVVGFKAQLKADAATATTIVITDNSATPLTLTITVPAGSKAGQVFYSPAIPANFGQIASVTNADVIGKGSTGASTSFLNKFSIHGKNDYNLTGFDTAMYSLNNTLRIGERMATPSLVNGNINPSDVVNDAMADQSIQYANFTYNDLATGTHTVEVYNADGSRTSSEVSNCFSGAVQTITVTTNDDVYNNMVKIINKLWTLGLNPSTTVLLVSNDLQTAIQLSPLYRNMGDLSKQEIANGFLGKVNGVPFMMDPTLGENAISTGRLDACFLDLRPSLIKQKYQNYTPLQVIPGNPEEYSILLAKACFLFKTCVIDNKSVQLFALSAVPAK